MIGEYLIPTPLHSRPRLTVGAIGLHGKIPREFYRLPRAWCIHAYRYEASLKVDGHPLEIRPGCASLFPADVDIAVEFRTFPSMHAYVHFELPRSRPLIAVPAMQSLGLRFDSFYADVERIISLLSVNRTRAEVKLWDLLWELAERHKQRSTTENHPAVAKVLQEIELYLAGRLRVRELADGAGISHNHLTRLFHQETGMSVIQYLRRRRIERARQLLMGSNRTIKSIAAEVGIADLQHFNKLIRRELGHSPRALRQGPTAGAMSDSHARSR